MANPRLTQEEREELFAPLLEKVKIQLDVSSGGDLRVLWAMRRKLAKELMYLERSTPAIRSKLKKLKWEAQKGFCAICQTSLAQKNSELDRVEAYLGYTERNTQLVHHECHVNDQAKKGYA